MYGSSLSSSPSVVALEVLKFIVNIVKLIERLLTDRFEQTLDASTLLSRLQLLTAYPYPPSLTSDNVIDLSPQVRGELCRFWAAARLIYPDQNDALYTYTEGKVQLSFQSRNCDGCPAHLALADPTTSEIIVIIRGTAQFSDWIINVCSYPAKDGSHSGIILAASLLQNKLTPVLQAFLRAHPLNWDIILTGHSLGGGVASLLAIWWREQNTLETQNIRAYSYGPPCIVNEQVAESCRSYVTAICLGRDIVARFCFDSTNTLMMRLGRLLETVEPDTQRHCDTSQEVKTLGGLNFTDIQHRVETAFERKQAKKFDAEANNIPGILARAFKQFNNFIQIANFQTKDNDEIDETNMDALLTSQIRRIAKNLFELASEDSPTIPPGRLLLLVPKDHFHTYDLQLPLDCLDQLPSFNGCYVTEIADCHKAAFCREIPLTVDSITDHLRQSYDQYLYENPPISVTGLNSRRNSRSGLV